MVIVVGSREGGVEGLGGGGDEAVEGWRWFLRPRGEFGVELRAEVEGVLGPGQFDDFHALARVVSP